MSGYVGNDGSALAGGLNPSGAVKALSVDANGNLNVNASVSSGPTNITQINSAAVSATNGLPVSGNNGGSLVVIDVDSAGRLYVNVNSLPALSAGSANIGGVEIFDSGGVNKLAIDGSGRLTLVPNTSINIAQWNGAAVSSTNPVLTNDQIRALIANGQGFRATTILIATGAGNAFIGWLARAQSLSVNVVIYRVLAVAGGATIADGRIYYNTTGANTDSGLTANLLTSNAANQQVGGAAPQLSVLNGSPSSTTQTSGMGGTGATQPGIFGCVIGPNEVLQQSSQIWLPKNTDRNVSMYAKIPSSGNSCGFMIEWVEF